MNNNHSIFKLVETGNSEQISSYIHNSNTEIWEVVDENGFTVLHRACFLNLFPQIKTIITEIKKKLNNTNITNNNKYKNQNILYNFINKKAKDDITALHYSSYRGNIDIIKLLIENGADVNAKTTNDINMLSMAARGDQPNSMIYFKEKYSMDINQRNSRGMTSLHFACEQSSEYAVTFLLSWGVDPNIKDNLNRTPLDYAINNASIKIIKKLLQNGANKDIKDNANKSPYDYAQLQNNSHINKIFKQRNICEFLFFRPKIQRKKFQNVNMIVFIFLHIFITAMSLFLIQPVIHSIILTYIYLGVFGFVIISYIVLYCSNPGKVKKGKRKYMLDYVERGDCLSEYCPYCCVRKYDNMKHCIVCGICIRKFDHHCFWVGNCIGKGNYIFFIVFLVIVNINILLNIIIGIISKYYILFT